MANSNDKEVEDLFKELNIKEPKRDPKLHNFDEDEVDTKISYIEAKQSGKIWNEDKGITTGNDDKKKKKWFIKKC